MIILLRKIKFIDLMMTLSQELQLSFEDKLTNYQEGRKMPLLMNIEQRALKRGALQTRQQDIIDLLEIRFGNLPASLVTKIQQIEDLEILKSLLIQIIKVNSLPEFEHLINDNSVTQN